MTTFEIKGRLPFTDKELESFVAADIIFVNNGTSKKKKDLAIQMGEWYDKQVYIQWL